MLAEIREQERPIRRAFLSPGDGLLADRGRRPPLSLRTIQRFAGLMGTPQVSEPTHVVYSLDARTGAALDEENRLLLWRTDTQERIPGPEKSAGPLPASP